MAIITFANQKGGVGKTTLCTLFANYLCTKEIFPFVLDCDSQKSITEKRQSDLDFYLEQDIPYSVQSLNIVDPIQVEKLLKQIQQINNIVLIDSPGHLSQQGLIPLFVYSDLIVTPYQYEATSINSTITFLNFLQNLKKQVPKMNLKIAFAPNKYDSRYGKKDEIELWNKTDAVFAKYGLVLPKIPIKIDLQRYNTISLFDNQKSIIESAFETLFKYING